MCWDVSWWIGLGLGEGKEGLVTLDYSPACTGETWVCFEYIANGVLIYRIQTWALEEARRRLEAEGILEDPENKK